MASRTRTRGATLVRGGAVGAVAALGTLAATWVFAGAKAASLVVRGPFGGGVPNWKAVLWLFYDSHFVGTRTPRVFGPDGSLWGGGTLVDTVSALGVEYLYAVPVVVLLVGGAVVARRVAAPTPRDGALAGATLVAGYLAIVVLGLFAATQGGVAPSPLRAVVVAGVVYPVALGAIGGAVAGLVSERRSDERGTTTV